MFILTTQSYDSYKYHSSLISKQSDYKVLIGDFNDTIDHLMDSPEPMNRITEIKHSSNRYELTDNSTLLLKIDFNKAEGGKDGRGGNHSRLAN